jgi:wyosine [tRNA(Phe)-imidazoG37] synthetase (radical SAM superfamily)
MSLGIDVIPRKVCSLDCVYCEVGKTTQLTVCRKAYIPHEKIIAELNRYFDQNHPDPDYFTFSGYGEPTLNSGIGEIIRFLKTKKPEVRVAVLTNGTLLHDRETRIELLKADIVLPSLDAVTPESFQLINRPEGSLDIDRYINGLIDFRNEYQGQIHLEVFILPGYNDGRKEIPALREALLKIKPDKIQLNTLDRPGTLEGLRAATVAELSEIAGTINLDQVEIISAPPDRKKIVSYRKDAEAAIVETISRRPCTLDDLIRVLGLHGNEINKYLDVLEAEGRIESIRQERGFFYQRKDK